MTQRTLVRAGLILSLLLSSFMLATPSADAVQSGQGCLDGTLVAGSCAIVGDPPTNGPPTCPVSATVFLDGNLCYQLVPATASCTAPAVADPNGTDCRTLVDLVPGPLVCATGAALVGPNCIINTPSTLGCTTGTLAGSNCVIIGDPPTNGPAICPVSATVLLDGNFCYRIVAALADGSCPAGSISNGTECRAPVALLPGALTCLSGFGLVNGQCVRYETAVLTCAQGTLQGNTCAVIAAPPTNGPPTCPVSNTVFLDGSFCYQLTPATLACTAPDLADPNSTSCRRIVAFIPGPLTCAPGFGLVIGQCIRYEAPVFLCNNQLVTINMRLGDSGIGTSGNDVILGTNGADIINARGGDDLICAGGGADDIQGAGGNDTIYGQGGADDIRGGSGNDDIRSGSGADIVRGNSGDDDIWGGNGDDDLRGGLGNDTIRGGNGDNDLNGGSGANDRCIGNAGTDTATANCEVTVSVP